MQNDIKLGKPKAQQIGDLELTSLDIKAETPEGRAAEADIQPNSLNFRLGREKHLNAQKWTATRIAKCATAVLFIVFLSSLTLRYADDLREGAINDLKAVAAKVRKKKIGKVAIPVLGQISLALKAHRPIEPVRTTEASSDPMSSCSAYISASINKKLKDKLSEEELLHVVNCQLFQDSVSAAQQGVQKNGLGLHGEVNWPKMYSNLLSLQVQRRTKGLHPLPVLAKQGCLRFSASADCLLRYVDESQLNFKGRWQDGFKALEKIAGDQTPAVRAWFYLASSLYASRSSEHARAESLLKTAHEAMKDTPNPFLEREIFRASEINAFLSRDAGILSRSLNLKPTARVEEDPRAFLDVTLLRQLSGATPKEDLEAYLTSSEARSRFAHDARFLGIVFRSSQQLNTLPLALTFAQGVLGKDLRPEALGDALLMHYARLNIGLGKGADALIILDRLERAGYRSAELYHVKGLAQLLNGTKSRAVLAAKDFQTSAGMSKNEESLFAITVTLLGSNNIGKAEQVIQQWKTLGPNAQRTSWYFLAAGLVHHLSGRKSEALAAWAQGEKTGKFKGMWTRLKQNLATDPSYLDQDLVTNLRYLMPAESPFGSLALSGQKS